MPAVRARSRPFAAKPSSRSSASVAKLFWFFSAPPRLRGGCESAAIVFVFVVPQIPASIALVKNIDIIGFYWDSYQAHKPDLLRGSFTQLFRWFQQGKLKPHVGHRLPLEQAVQGLELLKRRKSTGKVVLSVAN